MTRFHFANDGTSNLRVHAGRRPRTIGAIPIIHCHGYGGTTLNMMGATYVDDFRAMAQTSHPVTTSDQGGISTWANDTAIARVADQITYSSLQFGTRSDRVALIGDSMGALLALNWAWRNPGKPRAVVLRSPVVALEAFYDRNAVFQGAINSAYGGTLDEAELDSHDPMRNLDLIRPFGDRIAIWYATEDDYVPLSEVEAFAALVGATLFQVAGEHEDTLNVPPDQPAYWMAKELRKRRSVVFDWSDTSWDRLTEYGITNAVTNESRTVAVKQGHGRKGYWEGDSSTNGNDRRVYTLPDFQAVDSEILNFIDGGEGALMQQGNFHRVFVDEDGLGQSHVVWQNILFNVPWIMNWGVWHFDTAQAGTIGGGGFDTNQTAGYTVPALEIGSGGRILSASRTDGVITAICDFNQVPKPGESILVRDMNDSSFNGGFDVIEVNGSTMVLGEQVGQPDQAFGGDGAFANFYRVFPFWLMTRCTGASPSTMHLKAWQGDRNDEPEWDDPYYGTSGLWESGHYSGYGGAGFLIAHPVAGTPMVQGRVEAYEL
jgi:pimeloyl-ACP methyl ester carboxylesterase